MLFANFLRLDCYVEYFLRCCPMKRIFFFHITKTAGQSVTDLLYSNYSESLVYSSCLHKDGPNAGSDELFKNHNKYFEMYECFVGHYRSNILRFVPSNFFVFTFLRDPIARAVSWFYYLKKIELLDKDMTISDFFFDVPLLPKDDKTNARALFKQATNVYVRIFTNRLGGDIFSINVGHYRLAITNMQKYFGFIGFQEKYNESVFILSKLCGLKKVVYRKMNVISSPGEYRNYKEELGDELYNRVVEYNKFDIELYSYARNICNDRYEKILNAYRYEFKLTLLESMSHESKNSS
jgi:hypothetical protein